MFLLFQFQNFFGLVLFPDVVVAVVLVQLFLRGHGLALVGGVAGPDFEVVGHFENLGAALFQLVIEEG